MGESRESGGEIQMLRIEDIEILDRSEETETAEDTHHYFGARPTLEDLAEQQGVPASTDFDSLLGDFWPEDENADEFIAAVRDWRREERGMQNP